MIGITTMIISKEQMIAIVEYYLNENLFATVFRKEHKAKVIDQIRKSGDRFVVTFEGQGDLRHGALETIAGQCENGLPVMDGGQVRSA